jgi:hypothetical protein
MKAKKPNPAITESNPATNSHSRFAPVVASFATGAVVGDGAVVAAGAVTGAIVGATGFHWA